jgi:hypothetical protein
MCFLSFFFFPGVGQGFENTPLFCRFSRISTYWTIFIAISCFFHFV